MATTFWAWLVSALVIVLLAVAVPARSARRTSCGTRAAGTACPACR
ncbi:hypothetical protein C8D88_1069 [Lentzea atacamensis]|uniref:Uncharacterized protein n=1 Tax=Lentzea atacamensis TaxID=531938 RepID=A0A316HYY6_9PSEU|nr:hypothetical protein C8D88_1069 [Lentzea atacamensis]